MGSLGASMFASGRRLAALEGIGVALWGLPLTLCCALPHEPTVLALMCVVGMANALVDIGLYTLPARLVPEDLLARVFGAKESLTALSVALGSLVTPPAIDLLGVRGALAVLGRVGPALVALAWRRLLAIDGSITHRTRRSACCSRSACCACCRCPAIDSLARRVEHAHVDAGRDVFQQGERGDHFYGPRAGGRQRRSSGARREAPRRPALGLRRMAAIGRDVILYGLAEPLYARNT